MAFLNNSSVCIYLLEHFQVTKGDKVLNDTHWRRRKASALLQYMALEHHITKDQAIEVLWSDLSLESGSKNLYPVIHALRQTLDSFLGKGAADATFSFKDGVLALEKGVWVDVHEFRRISQLALSSSPLIQEQLETAVQLYRGNLLPSKPYDEWTLYVRDELRRLYQNVTISLASLKREKEKYTEAISLLTPLLEHNLADEFIHRELMRNYAYAGRRHDAIRQYQICIDALDNELGIFPSVETASLYNDLLTGDCTVSKSATTYPQIPSASTFFPPERSSPFVGRERELKDIVAELKEIPKQGKGKTVLISGDAGVGKTRLTYEVLQMAASLGFITLYGSAYEQEEQLSYQPFIEAFDTYIAQSQRLDINNPITNFRKSEINEPQQAQWALFDSIVSFLNNLASASPVVLVIDNLHSIDETSLGLFHFLVRQTQNSPIAILATYRIDTMVAQSPFTKLIHALYRAGVKENLRLERLRETEVKEILEYFLNGTPDSNLVKTTFDITEGNPFFVEEISQMLVNSDLVDQQYDIWSLRSGVALSVPSGLGGLLLERIERLGSIVTSILTIGAVIGREFSFDILSKVTSFSDGIVLDGLDTALDTYLLEETNHGYRFRHALIRQALYESLSNIRSAHLHNHIAEAIETTYAEHHAGIEPHLEALAFHYSHSNQRSRALKYLIRSGEKAATLYAYEVAIDYFERALQLIDGHNLVVPQERWKILESLGWWHNALAKEPRAVEYFEQALQRTSQDSWQPIKQDRARVHRGAAMALIAVRDMPAAEAHLSDALTEVNEHEFPDEYTHILYIAAQVHWHKGEYETAFEVAQKSLAISEQRDDASGVARAFEVMALSCHSRGEWQEGLTYERQRWSVLSGAPVCASDAFDAHL